MVTDGYLISVFEFTQTLKQSLYHKFNPKKNGKTVLYLIYLRCHCMRAALIT